MSHETEAISPNERQIDPELGMDAELRLKAESLMRGELDSKRIKFLMIMLASLLGIKLSQDGERGIVYLTSHEKRQLDVRFARVALFNPVTLGAIGLACAAVATDGHNPMIALDFPNPATLGAIGLNDEVAAIDGQEPKILPLTQTEGRVVWIHKVRSMKRKARDDELALTDNGRIPLFKVKREGKDPRITRIGRLIRRFSLDELPQLYDIWRGNLSAVGLRPPSLTEQGELKKHKKEVPFNRVLELFREGMPYGWTGLPFLCGRADLERTEDMWGLGVIYGENATLKGDLRILAWTPGVWASCRGAY